MVHDEYQNKMNSALDQSLSEAELAELHAQIAESEDATQEWEQMRKTDHLLRTTPMVAPSSAFARRVMDAITALPLPTWAKRELNAGLAVGLAAAALLAIPLLGVLFFLVLGLVTNPAVFTTLLQASIDVFSYGASLATEVADQVRSWIVGSPALAVLTVLIIPLSALWGWVLWLLLSGRGLASRRTRS